MTSSFYDDIRHIGQLLDQDVCHILGRSVAFRLPDGFLLKITPDSANRALVILLDGCRVEDRRWVVLGDRSRLTAIVEEFRSTFAA